MEKTSGPASRTLARLFTILDAGERGYAVAAANVNNWALKLFFKTNARQRADFKAELQSDMRPGGPGVHSLTHWKPSYLVLCALWGSVCGALAGIGIVHLPSLGLQNVALAVQEMAWAPTALGAVSSGAIAARRLASLSAGGFGADMRIFAIKLNATDAHCPR